MDEQKLEYSESILCLHNIGVFFIETEKSLSLLSYGNGLQLDPCFYCFSSHEKKIKIQHTKNMTVNIYRYAYRIYGCDKILDSKTDDYSTIDIY